MSDPVFEHYLDLALAADQNSAISLPVTPVGQRRNEFRSGRTPSPQKAVFQRACHRNFHTLLKRYADRQYDGNIHSVPAEITQQFKTKAEEFTRNVWVAERRRAAVQKQQNVLEQAQPAQFQTPQRPLQHTPSQGVDNTATNPMPNTPTPSSVLKPHLASTSALQTPTKQIIPSAIFQSPAAGQVSVTPGGFQLPTPVRFTQTSITPMSRHRTEEDELEYRQGRLHDTIENLNEMLQMRKTDAISRANYPYRQQEIIQRMHTFLLFQSGLLELASALQTGDTSSYYHLTQAANNKLQAMLPELQNTVRGMFHLIRDPTTRVSAISKTFTTFYDGFCGIKGRLCAEDRKRRNSQEKLADTFRITRLQVWHFLEPPDEDSELEEVLVEDGVEDPYGGGYALRSHGLGDGSF